MKQHRLGAMTVKVNLMFVSMTVPELTILILVRNVIVYFIKALSLKTYDTCTFIPFWLYALTPMVL